MQIVVIGVLIVMAMAGLGGAYKLGEDHATIARDAHWKQAVEKANKEKDDALEMAKLGLKSTDRVSAERLASLQAALEAKDREIADAADKIPLSQACQVCRVPAAHVGGMRDAPAGGADQNRVRGTPGR